jgi:hypothetical protein
MTGASRSFRRAGPRLVLSENCGVGPANTSRAAWPIETAHQRVDIDSGSGDAPITCQPLFRGSGVKTADRTLMSHSRRGQALIRSRVFEIADPDWGRRVAGKSALAGDSTGESQTHSPGI